MQQEVIGDGRNFGLESSDKDNNHRYPLLQTTTQHQKEFKLNNVLTEYLLYTAAACEGYTNLVIQQLNDEYETPESEKDSKLTHCVNVKTLSLNKFNVHQHLYRAFERSTAEDPQYVHEKPIDALKRSPVGVGQERCRSRHLTMHKITRSVSKSPRVAD
ncbi:hypothetical protein TNCV_3001041 [Trichonephila clavipes]|nr:hypothetical protein TNCV_3001041 [Trichonephila clavipes]